MADRYKNFATLASIERRGIDYDFRVNEREKEIAVIAPHGGYIEPGTTEIAEAIAGSNYSFYSFEGLRPGRPHGHLHVTSHLFDEPNGLKLVSSCGTAVAIHGRSDGSDRERVWMGGRNNELRERVAQALNQEGFPALNAPPGLAAKDSANICNRGTSGGGVQLELPRSLRDRLMRDAELLKRFADAVRFALQN